MFSCALLLFIIPMHQRGSLSVQKIWKMRSIWQWCSNQMEMEFCSSWIEPAMPLSNLSLVDFVSNAPAPAHATGTIGAELSIPSLDNVKKFDFDCVSWIWSYIVPQTSADQAFWTYICNIDCIIYGIHWYLDILIIVTWHTIFHEGYYC